MSTKHQKSMQASGKSDSGQEMKVVHQEAYQGPLPHPDLLKKFDEVSPGAAEKIIKMAESEQSHRHEMDSQFLKEENFLKKLGLILGFIIVMSIIGSGVYLLVNDKSAQGFSLILASVVTIISPFLVNKNKKQ